MQDWAKYERQGWSWSVGWRPNYGGYFAQAWRDYDRRPNIEGRLAKRQCFTEHGKTIDEAELKLQQRLEQLER